MLLQFDPETGKITYKGNEVGEYISENGRSTVRLNISYEGGDDWIIPLSWFAYGLAKLDENLPALALLAVETSEDSIAEEFEVSRFLTEWQVKSKGYVWKFHKSDVDDWPSRLHGHDYDRGLILDAITGNIYDAVTRELSKKLKNSNLMAVQAKLKASKDFKELASELFDNALNATDSA